GWWMMQGAPGSAIAEETLINFDEAITPIEGLPFGSVFRAVNQPHHYLVIPNAIEIERDTDGTPHLGLIHHGLSCKDKDGAGAYLLVSVRPMVGAVDFKQTVAIIKAIDPAAL